VIAGLVLAAGTSSRMGRHKLLLPLGGRPLVAHAVEAAFDAGCLDEVVVVVGRDADAVEEALGTGESLRFARNERFETGQASSLIVGIGAMRSDAEAFVVLLGDQPSVRPGVIAAVVTAFRDGAGPVVQASYSDRPAHPTLLARPVWPELAALTGDVGAREAIDRHREWLTLVEVGGQPPDDVDTDEDYRKVLAAFRQG
jgi:molybdenum cofactor cytidylyltransferase